MQLAGGLGLGALAQPGALRTPRRRPAPIKMAAVRLGSGDSASARKSVQAAAAPATARPAGLAPTAFVPQSTAAVAASGYILDDFRRVKLEAAYQLSPEGQLAAAERYQQQQQDVQAAAAEAAELAEATDLDLDNFMGLLSDLEGLGLELESAVEDTELSDYSDFTVCWPAELNVVCDWLVGLGGLRVARGGGQYRECAGGSEAALAGLLRWCLLCNPTVSHEHLAPPLQCCPVQEEDRAKLEEQQRKEREKRASAELRARQKRIKAKGTTTSTRAARATAGAAAPAAATTRGRGRGALLEPPTTAPAAPAAVPELPTISSRAASGAAASTSGVSAAVVGSSGSLRSQARTARLRQWGRAQPVGKGSGGKTKRERAAASLEADPLTFMRVRWRVWVGLGDWLRCCSGMVAVEVSAMTLLRLCWGL